MIEQADDQSLTSKSQEMTLKRKIIFSLITIIIGLVVVETGLRAIFFVKDYVHLKAKKKGWPQSSPYAGLGWGQAHFAEEAKTEVRFEPYYEWRRKEFHGRYVNISPDGVRKTWNPESDNPQNLKKVFCFGGSTMWGVGARDEFTIPSLLSKKLNKDGAQYLVSNYGEQAYSMTQELIFLVLQLKKGNIPDYVVFYDGVNEVMTASRTGQAGSIYNLALMREKLSRKEEGLGGAIVKELKNARIYRGIADLQARALRKSKAEAASSTDNDQETKILADAVVDDYIKTVSLIRALSQIYGFKPIFIWQPVLFTNKALTPEERKFGYWHDKMAKLYELVYDKMEKNRIDQVHNISTIFDTKTKTMFFSYCHISEEGNDIVAGEIYRIFQENLKS